MARTISTGNQDFASIRENGYFYVDKTALIREWWESGDVATLITRPRRFGKTLNMSMLDWFLSLRHAGRADLFEGLDVLSGPEGNRYREMQGTWPVVFLSFADVKERTYEGAREAIAETIVDLYEAHAGLLESPAATDGDRLRFSRVSPDAPDAVLARSIRRLCDLMERVHGRKAIVLLDEYDAPMQEAWANGYWDEMVGLTRALFNSTFKTNPAMERGIMTGVTRVSKESIFSDLNNLEVVSTTSRKYETSFGFTEAEVGAALEEFGMDGRMPEVQEWYDGFRFGEVGEIYNPWSVAKFLETGEARPYWANTSSNSLASGVVRTSGPEVKEAFEDLLAGGSVTRPVTEEVVFSDLGRSNAALWGLLIASGYLRVDGVEGPGDDEVYELSLTNREVRFAFRRMVPDWFEGADGGGSYRGFVRALLGCDARGMTRSLSRVLVECASAFDGGTRASAEAQPERFYHGLVLGLLVTLEGRYRVRSNRESGFGRYDVMLEPTDGADPAFVIEFKVRDPEDGEASLEDALASALAQIDAKNYDAELASRGIAPGRIRHVGMAFEGKRVLVGVA